MSRKSTKRSVSKKSMPKKAKLSVSKKSKRSVSKKSRGKGITRSSTQATLVNVPSKIDSVDPLLYQFAKSLVPLKKSITQKTIRPSSSQRTLVPSGSQTSLFEPVKYTEEDENKLFRQQFLDKKSRGPFQKLGDYFKYRGVQVGKKF